MAKRLFDDWGDAEVLAAGAERDRGALEELYRRHEPWLSTRLGYRGADRSTVQEPGQDRSVIGADGAPLLVSAR